VTTIPPSKRRATASADRARKRPRLVGGDGLEPPTLSV
jgi:hypothetical protein